MGVYKIASKNQLSQPQFLKFIKLGSLDKKKNIYPDFAMLYKFILVVPLF